MSKKFKMMIPCDEANHVCDKTQYKDASLWEMVKLNLHLLYCKACREYTKNNTKLTKKIKESKVVCLDKRTKENMKKDFDSEIRKKAL